MRPYRLEERTDLGGAPVGDLLEHRHQHAERVVAQHGAPRDARDVLVFRDSDREAVAVVHVQHHVDVGAPVANVVVQSGEMCSSSSRRSTAATFPYPAGTRTTDRTSPDADS